MKDRLDGSSLGGCLFELYTAPGRFILWLKYMFPQKGKLWTSGRHARSPIMTFIVATLFWAFLVFYLSSEGVI